MLIQQLVQMKALKEGQMKNAIMDTVEDHCRNTDIPDGLSYEQAVSLIVKSIMNTDTMAAELPSRELTEYVKDYFAREDYEDVVKEAHDTDMEFPKILGKAGEFSVELNDGEQVSLMRGNKEVVSMPLVIWKQLSR